MYAKRGALSETRFRPQSCALRLHGGELHQCVRLVDVMSNDLHLASVISGRNAIEQMFMAGQRRWPTVELSFEAFAAHCRQALDPGRSRPVEAADLYLCCACAAAHPEALKVFEREGQSVAKVAIRRIDSDEDFVRDTLQELWSRLLVGSQARVRSYSGQGPLQAWLRVAATRLALDRRRARKRGARREVALSDTLEAVPFSPEASLLKARFGDAFRDALRAAVGGLSKQARNVLRMHVVGHCSIDEIGRAYNVHRATAARWIDRSRSTIYARVQQELGELHPLTDSEFRSLAGLMGPELHLSLSVPSTAPNAANEARDSE
jgi:RNA polymerase sigma-70 factor, ECF subfamily